MTRYFYDESGNIVGDVSYNTICMIQTQCNSIGYIDSDTKVDSSQYCVDLSTKTLVAVNQ